MVQTNGCITPTLAHVDNLIDPYSINHLLENVFYETISLDISPYLSQFAKLGSETHV